MIRNLLNNLILSISNASLAPLITPNHACQFISHVLKLMLGDLEFIDIPFLICRGEARFICFARL